MSLEGRGAPKQLEDRFRNDFVGAMNRFLHSQRETLPPEKYRELMGFFDATDAAMKREDLAAFTEARKQWIPIVQELQKTMMSPDLASALFARSGQWKQLVEQKLKDRDQL